MEQYCWLCRVGWRRIWSIFICGLSLQPRDWPGDEPVLGHQGPTKNTKNAMVWLEASFRRSSHLALSEHLVENPSLTHDRQSFSIFERPVDGANAGHSHVRCLCVPCAVMHACVAAKRSLLPKEPVFPGYMFRYVLGFPLFGMAIALLHKLYDPYLPMEGNVIYGKLLWCHHTHRNLVRFQPWESLWLDSKVMFYVWLCMVIPPKR